MSEQIKLCQFYTKPSIVEQVLTMVDCEKYDLIIEPSAGAGDFLDRLPPDKSVGIDLIPAALGIQKGDFLEYVPKITENVLTIGNPPFGKRSSLAVKFFNHAAQFSDCIAFVLPRTFRKPEVINRLHSNFHLIQQKLLPLDSFYIPSGETYPYQMTTVFQVWEKRENCRAKVVTTRSHPDFDFVGIENPPTEQQKKIQCQNADFCVRRVGAYAGRLYKDYDVKYRDWKSHYYIKPRVEDVERIMSLIPWDDVESPKFDTSGNPSISRHDLVKFYVETKKAKVWIKVKKIKKVLDK